MALLKSRLPVAARESRVRAQWRWREATDLPKSHKSLFAYETRDSLASRPRTMSIKQSVLAKAPFEL